MNLTYQQQRLMVTDLGWSNLWNCCKRDAVRLFLSMSIASHDSPQGRVSRRTDPPAGSWFWQVRRIMQTYNIPTMPIAPGVTNKALKHHVKTYMKTVVVPRLRRSGGNEPSSGPLPWAWLAVHGDVSFPRSAFDLWWQIRALGTPPTRSSCPRCAPGTPCTRSHLEETCPSFAVKCWANGVKPEEAFSFPTGDQWFKATLLSTAALNEAWHAAGVEQAPYQR